MPAGPLTTEQAQAYIDARSILQSRPPPGHLLPPRSRPSPPLPESSKQREHSKRTLRRTKTLINSPESRLIDLAKVPKSDMGLSKPAKNILVAMHRYQKMNSSSKNLVSWTTVVDGNIGNLKDGCEELQRRFPGLIVADAS